MSVQLTDDLEQLIFSRVRTGKYASAQDVVRALQALSQDETRGRFAPSGWDTLLAEGEASGEGLDGEAVLAEVRAKARSFIARS